MSAKLLVLSGAWALVTVACGGADLTSDEAPVPGDLVVAGANTLTAVSSGRCLGIVGGATAEGALVEQRACNGGAAQRWNLRSVDGGLWEIVAAVSGKCLDVAKMSVANGAALQQWTCAGSANQRWRLIDGGNTQVELQSAGSGKCADVTKMSLLDGALIQQWSCAGSANQRFTATVVSSGGGSGGAPGTGGAQGSAGAPGTAGASGTGGAPGNDGSGGAPGPLTGAGHVTLEHSGASFTLLRDGQPYFIKGIAGGAHLDLARRSGANSLRTYSSGGAAGTLNNVKANGMTLLLGISLDQNAASYTSDTFKNGKRSEITTLLAQVKDHPALLMWALGNEINLGADTMAAWQFVDELAQLIHAQDPNHPVMTVIAGDNATAINHVAQWAPHIDVIGVNAYKRAPFVDGVVKSTAFAGPYVVTEFGPTGQWESPTTSWGRPIEQTSDDKRLTYGQRYAAIAAHRDRALGSYVFLWAQKEEQTPTWYGMFLETQAALGIAGESCPTVDAMALAWSGVAPANRAPAVTALTVNGLAAGASVTLTAGQAIAAQVTATDPEGDPLSFRWEILDDGAQAGASSTRPTRIGAAQTTTAPTLPLVAPATAGFYRLYVYALDGKGHVGTANVPFQVN